MDTSTKPGTHSRHRMMALACMPVLIAAAPAFANEIDLPPVSVGAGLRTSFTHTDIDGSSPNSNDFSLDSVRLYISGTALPFLKFSFNTDYDGDDSKLTVIDAIARFEFSPMMNIWAGRFLPPSDRANLNGPYYSNEWGFASDGIEDGFPFYAAGRDNGVAYWGDFGNLKISFGGFDAPATDKSSPDRDHIIVAGRIQYDFWDAEPGYYLNGTYYGDKDILALGVAAQHGNGDTAVTVDGLLEKKLAGGGVISAEGEYAHYDAPFSGYGYADPDLKASDGGFGLAAFLFPQKIGIGQIQLLGKYATNRYDVPGTDVWLDTLEVNVNYVIKTFNARVSLFFIDSDYRHATGDNTQVGLGLQIQI